jgi:hypothetical protein
VATAYRILGYDDVHHGLETIFTSPQDYEVFQRAADATFPFLPTYTGVPFTRADWDEVFGRCEAVTDVASFFAPQLIEAYPEAKVVLVVRDEEAWLRSTRQSLTELFTPFAVWFSRWVEPALGSYVGPGAWRFHAGWFRADTLEGAMANALGLYREHNETIRRMVPPERLLEFRLADGWAPLCEFLGKEVPDVPFPRVNEAAQFQEMKPRILAMHWASFKRIYGWKIVAGSVVALGMVARYQGLV